MKRLRTSPDRPKNPLTFVPPAAEPGLLASSFATSVSNKDGYCVPNGAQTVLCNAVQLFALGNL
jgi:hypothetical protein